MENEIEPKKDENEAAYKPVEGSGVKKAMPASIITAVAGISVYILLSILLVVSLAMQGNIKASSGALGMIIWAIIAFGLAKRSLAAWWGAMVYSILGLLGTLAAVFIGKSGITISQILLALGCGAPLAVVLIAINMKSAKEYIK
ncbi:MAG: hypothetical protein ABSA34_02160 [Candidatus Goldiibacteriota bacterium]|jgi:hypothetical protein